MNIAPEKWGWFGSPGHFICSQDCRFHMCTKVGDYLVSTVGEYFPDNDVREIIAKSRGINLAGKGDARRASYMKQIGYETIGLDRTYETVVFLAGPPCAKKGCGCGMPLPDDYTELDFDGYNDPGAATKGHREMCSKWANQEGSQ